MMHYEDHKPTRSRRAHSAIATLAILASSACGSSPPPIVEGETGCEPEHAPIELEHCGTLLDAVFPDAPCGPCYGECHNTYWCHFADGSQPEDGCPICAENQIAADSICQSADFLDSMTAYAVEQPCNLPISCTGWNPGNEVTGTHPNYQVDQTFINSIVADPTLLHCDSSHFTYDAAAQAFKAAGISAGSLLSELGFQNGDILLEVNNYPVQNASQVALAFGLLWFAQPSTLSIEFERSNTAMSFSVTIN